MLCSSRILDRAQREQEDDRKQARVSSAWMAAMMNKDGGALRQLLLEDVGDGLATFSLRRTER